jgi:hypothetical protein
MKNEYDADSSSANMDVQSGNDCRNAQVYRVWAAYITMGMLLAILLPSDIVTAIPLLGDFTELMSGLIPSIEKIASVSAFPEVTRTYFSVMWATQPLLTAFTIFQLRWELKRHPLSKLIWVTFLGVPMLALFVYITLFLPGDVVGKIDHGYSSGRGKAFFTLLNNYRPMLGLIGGIVLLVSMVFQYCILLAYPRTFIHQFKHKDQS